MRANAEEVLALQLRAQGIGFEREYRFDPVRKWRADFRLTDHRVLIEVEGVRYGSAQATRHQHGHGYEEDCIKYNAAVLGGWSVLRFTPNMVFGKGRGKSKRKVAPAISVICALLALRR